VIAKVVGEDFVEAANEWEALGALGTLNCLAVNTKTDWGDEGVERISSAMVSCWLLSPVWKLKPVDVSERHLPE
jgi:hypothetical protein